MVQFIKELFPIKCCVCKQKYKAEEMTNWFGLSYVCEDCFTGTKKSKPKMKGIKTRKHKRGKNKNEKK